MCILEHSPVVVVLVVPATATAVMVEYRSLVRLGHELVLTIFPSPFFLVCGGEGSPLRPCFAL